MARPAPEPARVAAAPPEDTRQQDRRKDTALRSIRGERIEAARLPLIGWREWVALPQLGITWIKPKVDTGARSSSLHAFDVEEYIKGGRRYVRFKVHPMQRTTDITVAAEAEVLDYRQVRSSSGLRSLRPVIRTEIEILGKRWSIELTLANRDEMGFRMLLGREAVRNRFLVDAGRSYYGGRPRARKRKVATRPTRGGDDSRGTKRTGRHRLNDPVDSSTRRAPP